MNHEAENKFLGMLVLSRFNNYFKKEKKKCVTLVKLLFFLLVCLIFFFHYACVNVCNLASPPLQWYKELCRLNSFFFSFFFFCFSLSGKTFGTLFDVYIKMWHYTRKFRYFANCFVWGTSLKKRFNVCQSCIQINRNLWGMRTVPRLFIYMSSAKFSTNLAP